MWKFLVILLCLFFLQVSAENGKGEKEKKGRKPKGKQVRMNEEGNIDITISRRKWSDEKQSRTLCCPLAAQHCKYPCRGASCSAQCTLSCGLFSLYSCAPVSCGTANPFQCVASATCPSGWTVSGSKCFNLFEGPANWLEALQTCIAQGGSLAKIESQAEQDLVFGLMGNTGRPAWIGLQDFLVEGDFSWADGSTLGTYQAWLGGQPDNAGNRQDCVVLRNTDGLWNDVICNGANRFVCQRASS